MATSNTSANTTGSTDGYQNLLLQLLQRYENSQQRDDLQQGVDANRGIVDSNRAIVEAARPQGMDFSAFAPLMDAIGSRDFTKQAAIQDSQGFINQIFRDFENTSLPQIYSNPRASGIYNDTSTQLLANDAYSSAVAKGQSQLVQNILAYANARQAQLNPVLALMQGQVSNSNALMGAQAQHTGHLVNAGNAQLGVQGQQNTLDVQGGAQNRGDNAATIGAIYGAYQQYQQNQAQQNQNNTPSNTDTGSGNSTYTGGSISDGGGQYADDYYDLGGY